MEKHKIEKQEFEESMLKLSKNEPEQSLTENVTPVESRKKLFGRGIYGSKDVPIRLLDGVIAIFILAIVAMVVYFTINGGYAVTFHTFGGSEVASQNLRYGELVAEPELPIKPGYHFEYWYQEEESDILWIFQIKR